MIIGNIYIHFFLKEKQDVKKNSEGIIQTIKKISFFGRNKNIRFLIIFLLTRLVGIYTMDGIWN